MATNSHAPFSWTKFLSILVFTGCCLLSLVTSPAVARPLFSQPVASAISTVRLGDWQDRTRLVLEGVSGMSAEIEHGSSATELSLLFYFPEEHDFPNWLEQVIPGDHPALQRVQISDLQSKSARVRFHFHSPVSLNIFDLRPMEGFQFRLVLDFYQLAKVSSEQWLDVFINNKGGFGTVLALTTLDHDVFLAGSDLERWRIELPAEAYVTHYQQPYYSLRQLGVRYQINPQQLQLNIEVPAAQFARLRLRGHERERPQLTASSLGAFFNYDLNATEREDDLSASGLLELGLFNRWGSGSTRVLARNESEYHEQGVIRLDTQWRYDNPERMTTLIVGDSISRSASWNRATRFAGVQWGTNFSTQPEMLTMPTLSFVGEASQPSTIDLFINEALRFRTEVPAGPFSIDDLPAITGYGEARMVVTDILGREQVIQQNYFANRRMLRAGLHDYSIELGYIRQNFGLRNDDYGPGMVSGLHRFGLTNNFTSEVHLQATTEQQLGGVGASYTLPWNSLVHAAVATSYGDGRRGQLLSIGMQYQRRRFNFGIDAEIASDNFERVGSTRFAFVPRQQLRAFSSYSTARSGTLSLSYTEQDFRTRQGIQFINAGYSIQFARFVSLRFSALHYLDDEDTRFNLTLSVPLGWNRTSASVSAQNRGDDTSGYAQLQRSLPSGTGVGYRLRQGLSERDLSLASIQYQNDHARYSMDISKRQDMTATRAGLRGAFTLMHGQLSASRQLNRSFALVQLPDFPNVRVYADNQLVGRTNDKGNAMIPRLRPYQRNRIRIEQADLPMNATIDSLEQEVAPYYRSGIKLEFPVRLTRSAFFRILLPNGEPVPVGATASSTNDNSFMVGHRGETYMTALQERNEVHVRWGRQRCSFVLSVPLSDDALLDLGTATCHPEAH
ncbi:hypothetical protein CWE12_12735 [Aliidiomarina sedimenti]|uniref:PapC-like C-terminal domain-containing protein n=1 Tax=Aliidiomarina sedimenti TaxID=1933879 RepID=A0ABY0BV39_9GAMM|nr:fimbria/pilus outer membrane usher protein [Aliidiomarina sedimenti]RUO28081.1 hypothetical protein CWE12_12735 [Aliidiomarina sedimenti]